MEREGIVGGKNCPLDREGNNERKAPSPTPSDIEPPHNNYVTACVLPYSNTMTTTSPYTFHTSLPRLINWLPLFSSTC